MTLKSPDLPLTERREEMNADNKAPVQRLLRRLEYLDDLLCNYYREEKDGIWAKCIIKEKSRWRPDVGVRKECKHLGYNLRNADEASSDLAKVYLVDD